MVMPGHTGLAFDARRANLGCGHISNGSGVPRAFWRLLVLDQRPADLLF